MDYTNTDAFKAENEKPVTKSVKVLEEVKNVLLSESNKDSDCISLYIVAQALKIIKKSHSKMIIKHINQLKSIVKDAGLKYNYILIWDSQFSNGELELSLGDNSGVKHVTFAKDDDELYIKQNETSTSNEKIFMLFGSTIAHVFEEDMLYYKNALSNYTHECESVNSNLYVTIADDGVYISDSTTAKSFELCFSTSKDSYSCESNSYKIVNALSGKGDEIFKKIFVKIEDCPEWSRDYLYEIRQNQLEEEKIKSNEKMQSEELLYRKKIHSLLKR